MNITTITVALLWGAISGLLAIHSLANLLATGFCLHGILMTRWKRLTHKAATGVVRYGINLRLLLRVVFYTLLFGGLLSYLFLRPQWKALEAEVAEFIRTAPAFQAGAQPAEPDTRQREAA